MYRATKKDRSTVIKIITDSFHNNPSVRSVVNPRKKNGLQALAQFAFDTAIMRDGVHLSSDKESVAICYIYGSKKEGLVDLKNQLQLVMNCIGISKLFATMKREAYVEKQRPPDGKFLYFWFFGATQQGIRSKSAISLKNHIFQLSRTTNLPIYLETSVSKNRRVYEHFQFEVYHEWEQENGTTLWFMKRSPI